MSVDDDYPYVKWGDYYLNMVAGREKEDGTYRLIGPRELIAIAQAENADLKPAKEKR